MTSSHPQSKIQDKIAETLYDSRASSYDDSWHASFVKDFLRLVYDPPLEPGNRCIDLCCGTGLVTFLIAERIAPTGHVFGIDVSKGMLDVARGKLEKVDAKQADCVHLISHNVDNLGSIEPLVGMEDTFDLISCASALVLLRDARAAVTAWADWLKPGFGRLIVDVPPPSNAPYGVLLEAAARKADIYMPYNRSWITGKASLPNLLEGTGKLKVERVQFVEQQGWKRRWHDASNEEAERWFGKMVNSDLLVPWSTGLDAETKDRLKESFCAEWRASANEDGKVEEVDGVWVAVARRL